MSSRIDAAASDNGLAINGHLFDMKLALERYQPVLGSPTRTISAGPPDPTGQRSNQIHLFDTHGLYLTEHHATRFIESVNFIFDPSESPFPIDSAFSGILKVCGFHFRPNMLEKELDPKQFSYDLSGEYSAGYKHCWVGVSSVGKRRPNGKRMKAKHVVSVSVCLNERAEM